MTDALFLEPEHEMLRDQVRRFVEDEIKPHAETWEADGMVPREVLKRMGALGFFGIRYPEAYGGAAMDTRATAVWSEELGRSSFSGVAITALVHTDMASVHLFNAGTEAQRDRWMPGIVSGEVITAVGVTEPGAGSDVKGIRTRATRKGNSAYVLNGSKTFITNGVLGDLYCIAAKTDPAGPPSQSVTIFLVEKGTPGFTVARQLDKHGWLSSDTAELHFEDCEIPAENVLGQEGRGFYAIMQNFQNERIVLGAMAMGEAQAAIDLTVDYVKTRQAFGAPLWDKQAIRQRLAMLQARVSAARHLVYATARRDAEGEEVVKEVSMIKALCGELVNEVMYDCLQFHGGTGFMRGTAIERMTRDARVQAIGGGATEVMLEEVAKRM
jgi:acyl-CoA dehydrogenase